jgi:hypothetical protein
MTERSKKIEGQEIDQVARESFTHWLESSAGIYLEAQLGALATNTTRYEKRRCRKQLKELQKAGSVLIDSFEGFQNKDRIIREAKEARAQTIFNTFFPKVSELLGRERSDEVATAIVRADMSSSAGGTNSFIDHVESEQKLIAIAGRKHHDGSYDYDLMTTTDHIKYLVNFWHPRTVQSWLREQSDELKLSQIEKEALKLATYRPQNWTELVRPSGGSAAAANELDSQTGFLHPVPLPQ